MIAFLLIAWVVQSFFQWRTNLLIISQIHAIEVKLGMVGA